MSRVAWTLTDNEQATPVVYHFEVNPKVDQGSLGELNPTLKTVLDIIKGISSVRGR